MDALAKCEKVMKAADDLNISFEAAYFLNEHFAYNPMLLTVKRK